MRATEGRFWQAHSLLLAGRDRFSVKDLVSVARQLDLDPAEAESVLRERRYRERVLRDVAGAERAGVHGTPTFYVGAERLEGGWRQLAQLVPAILERR